MHRFSKGLLYLSIWSVSWCTLVTGLPVKDLLSPCSLGRPTLKVLMATSSKSPSISLYISQYLSEYAFKVSPSHIDRNSSKSKGLGTLLHVTKREPKACVNYFKEFMELALNLLNHLIATGPRLKRNIFHNKASSFEWIAILWLNWLTCSTESDRPL